jgi:hypothetical protein
VILVGCGKTKLPGVHIARELYVSPLFHARIAYADAHDPGWFLLSAKYGLVEQSTRLRSYDFSLRDLSATGRRRWGEAVAAALERRHMTLAGETVEIHAGRLYADALVEALERRGASVTTPLAHLPGVGAQIAWYRTPANRTRRRVATRAEVRRALRSLECAPERVPASEWPDSLSDLTMPGLYLWWVDTKGGRDLSSGLGVRVKAGQIYAGQAGATRWPSGRQTSATLRSRISRNHLAGTIESSTFRRTLAAALRDALGLERMAPGKLASESEKMLSSWMRQRLAVTVHRFPEADALTDLEHRVLAVLDPPLNLEGMPMSHRRRRLSTLRAELGRTAPRPARRQTARGAEARHAKSIRSRGRADSPTLHDEIATVLAGSGGGWVTREQIADEVNKAGRYRKQDGSAMTAFQVARRAYNYSALFEIDGSRIRLKRP